jgi:TonB family protein
MVDSSVLRILLSFGAALCVVLVMLVIGLEVSGFTERRERRALEAHEVSLLSEFERRDFRELLEDPQPPRSGALAPLAEIPALALQRRVRGIVQLEVFIGADGVVEDVRVLDASPPGLYEQAAVEEIRGRQYPQEVTGGAAAPYRRLEIIDFELAPTPPGR